MSPTRTDMPTAASGAGQNPGAAASSDSGVDLAHATAPRISAELSVAAKTTDRITEPEKPRVADRSREATLGSFGADVDAARRENATAVLGLDIAKIVEVPRIIAAANQHRHEELRNAGLESGTTPLIPSGIRPATSVSVAARSAQQRQETLQSEPLVLMGPRKKKTGNREIDDFIEQHPELAPLALRMQNELAAVARANEAGRSGLESKANLEAALDRIVTLLEGQPIAPMLRMGDRAAHDALVKLLVGNESGAQDFASAVIAEVSSRLVSPHDQSNTESARAIDPVTLEALTAHAAQVGRLRGRIAAGETTGEVGARLKDAERELERYLAASGDRRSEVAAALRAIELRERERGLLERISERVYELQLEATIQASRPGGEKAQQALEVYLRSLTNDGILARHPEFANHLKTHSEGARQEGTEILRRCREAAAEVLQSSYWTFAEGGTDERRLCCALEGRTQRELDLIKAIFAEDFGRGEYKTVDTLIEGETEGSWRDRALRALHGDTARTGREPRGLSEEGLADSIRTIHQSTVAMAVNSRDRVTLAALELESVAESASDPALAIAGAVRDFAAEGVKPDELGAALKSVGFDPLALFEARAGSAASSSTTFLQSGRDIVAAVVAGQAISDEALFNYLADRAERHAVVVGRLEGEEHPDRALIEVQDRRFAEGGAITTTLVERYPEARKAIDEIVTIGRDKARAERVLEIGIALNRHIGIEAERENQKKDGPRTKAAEERYQAFERTHADLAARHPNLMPVLAEYARESQRAGQQLAIDVKGGIRAFQKATTDNWLWGESAAAATVLRGKSPEWLRLFKEEFAAHKRSEGQTAASAALEYLGEPGEPEFDRVHALLSNDSMGALAADTQVALAEGDRARVVALFEGLKTAKERSELSAIFAPRYAAQNSRSYTEPIVGSTHDRTVTVTARSLDEAIDLTFDGDGKTIVGAALSGNTPLRVAAEVSEGLNSSWDPALKGAQALEQHIKDDFGRIDPQKVAEVEKAYQSYKGGDIRSGFDSIHNALHWDDQTFAKSWGKALLAGDDTGAAAAKLKAAVGRDGDGTHDELVREACAPAPLVTELGHTLQRGEGFTADQIARATKGGGELTTSDVDAILRHHGKAPTGSATVTPKDLEQVLALGDLPPGVRAALPSNVGDTTGGRGLGQLVAYARYCEAIAAHQAARREVDKRYERDFRTPVATELKRELSDHDYRYVDTLRNAGVVSRGMRYLDAVEGLGTTEAVLDELTIGITKEQALSDAREVAALKEQKFEGRTGEDVLASPLGELVLGDVSGDYDFDLSERLRGRPETADEVLAAARRRFEHEDNWFIRGHVEKDGILGFIWRDSYNEMKDELKRLEANASAGGAELHSASAAFTQAADQYRLQKNMVADTAANVGATVVVVGGSVVVIVGSGGSATPLVLAGIAAGGGAVRTGTKAVLKGGAYGWEEVALDGAITGVDLASLGIMTKVPLGQVVSHRILAKGGEAVALRGGAGAVSVTGQLAEREALVALGQSSRVARIFAGAGQGAVDGAVFMPLQTIGVGTLYEETWQDGVGAGLSNLLEQGAYSIPLGVAFGVGAGAAGGVFTPRTVKLARAIDPKDELKLVGKPGTAAPEGNGLTGRAQDHLRALQESNGIIRRIDVEDAKLMSKPLSKKESAGLIEKAKTAGMAEPEIKGLQQRLKDDGSLSEFDRVVVKRSGQPREDTPTVIERTAVEKLHRSVGESKAKLEQELAQPGITSARKEEVSRALRALERRGEALHRLDEAITSLQQSVKERLGTVFGLKPVGPGRPLDDRSDGAIADRAAKGASEAGGTAAKPSSDTTGAPKAPAEELGVSAVKPAAPDSPAVVSMSDDLRALDDGIVAREKFIEHIRSRLAKADRATDGMVDVADGVRVPRDGVERQLAKDVEGLDALRAERGALNERIQAQRDTDRIVAERQEMGAVEAAKVRAEAREPALAQEHAATENRIARETTDRSVDEGAAQVRREAAERMRVQEEMDRAAIAQRELERGAPIERYVPKSEPAKSPSARLKEIDDLIVQKERFVEVTNQKLAEGGETVRFGEAVIPRGDVELGVKGVQDELAALRAEREVLQGGPRRSLEPARTIEQTPVPSRGSDPIESIAGPAFTDGGGGVGPRLSERAPSVELRPAPLELPSTVGRGRRVEFQEPVVDPQLQRLLNQAKVPQLEVVEPSPAIAQKVNAAQEEIVRLESLLAKHGAGIGIEDLVKNQQAILTSLEARASAQHRVKLDIRRTQKDIDGLSEPAKVESARRFVDGLETRLRGDDGTLDLSEISAELKLIRRSIGVEEQGVGVKPSVRPDEGGAHEPVPTRANDEGGSGGSSAGDKDLDSTPDWLGGGGGGRGDDGGGVATLEKPAVKVDKKIDFEKEAEKLAEQISRETAPPPAPKTDNPEVQSAPRTAEPPIKPTPDTEGPVVKTAPETKDPVTKTVPDTENPGVKTAPATKEAPTKGAPTTEEPGVQSAPKTEEPKAKPVAEPAKRTSPAPSAEPVPELEPAAQPGFKVSPRRDPRTKVIPRPEPELQPQPKLAPQPQAKLQPEQQPQLAPRPQPLPQSVSQRLVHDDPVLSRRINRPPSGGSGEPTAFKDRVRWDLVETDQYFYKHERSLKPLPLDPNYAKKFLRKRQLEVGESDEWIFDDLHYLEEREI